MVIYQLHESDSYCLPGFNASGRSKYWQTRLKVVSPAVYRVHIHVLNRDSEWKCLILIHILLKLITKYPADYKGNMHIVISAISVSYY